MTMTSEQVADLAIRAAHNRNRAEQAETILADIVTAHHNLCTDPHRCNCPIARAIRHIKERQ